MREAFATKIDVLHFYWLVKADTRVPLLYAAILAFRLPFWNRKREKAPRPARVAREPVQEA